MAWRVVGYSGVINSQRNSNKFRLVVDGDYTGPSGTSYTVKGRLRMMFTGSYTPYYLYRHTVTFSINDVSKYNGALNEPNADSDWKSCNESIGGVTYKRYCVIGEWSQSVNPGGPSYNCSISGSYSITGSAIYLPVRGTYSASGTINLPTTWVAPTQTFVTQSNNKTANNNVQSGDKSYTDTYWSHGAESYAGDSFNYVWDKNNQGNVGSNANPRSTARLCRTSSSGYDAGYTNVYMAWDWDYGGNDKYISYDRIATASDCGYYLQARMWKAYTNSSGSAQTWIQSSGHFIKAAPTLSSNVALRSQKFYLSTPSVLVYRLNTFTINNNGYGVKGSNSSAGETGNATITKNKVHLTIDGAGYNGGFDVYYGNGRFNENYSLPITPIHIHTNKITPNNNSGRGQALAYTNWFNPRTGATGRLGLLSQDLGRPTIVSGSIDLPVIDSIVAVSGNGTTVVVEDTKKIYTTQSSPIITWRINHSGNDNGFGYDIRRTENSGSYATSTVDSGGGIAPVNINSWSGTTGGIDVTSGTYNIQHNSITTSGSSQSVTIVPYIRDSANYQIFGEKTRSYVTADPYTIYLIQKPNTPTLNTWSNTLPAIDGIKDVINWTATSPSSWGNVTDFTRGYKLRYRIGIDEPHQNGYEWYYTNTPTTTNTSFSGSFTEIYNRDEFTSCTAQIAATSYYSTVWDAYLDFQSSYSTQKSFNISAQDPYKATTGTLTTPMSTTLLNEIPFTFQCPSETINGNTLTQSSKLIIDGGTEVELATPNYSTSTPNSLTGALTVSFSPINDSTPALTRGVHTLKVTNEVTTYFDSVTPVENHVYFGTTVVESNELDVEIAELPLTPTLNAPSPAYHYAGQTRTFNFSFSSNDWGCLDTTYNNQHFEYQILWPNGDLLASGNIDRDETELNYTFTPVSPSYDGVYTFKLRETTVVGSSDWVEQTVEIFAAQEPSESTITTSNIIALSGWKWNLNIVPGDNGTYAPVTTAPITRVKADVILPPTNLYNKDFRTFDSQYITEEADGWYKVLCDRTSATDKDYIDFWADYNYLLKPNTTYSYVLELKNININNNATFYIGNTSNNNSQFATQISQTIVPGQADTTYIFNLTTREDMRNIALFCSRDFIGVTAGYYIEFEMRISLIEGIVTEDEFVYSEYTDPYVQNALPWTNYNNLQNIDLDITTDLNGYEDGLYSMLVQYQRYYTTRTIAENVWFDVIPPSVELTNNSYIISASDDSDIISFRISIDVFAATTSSLVQYSMDYGQTWTDIPNFVQNGAIKTYTLDLDLSWLDVIYIKANGVNPIYEQTETWIHEMPSNYLVWLSWADRGINSIYTKPSITSLELGTGTYTAGSGDTGSWEIEDERYVYTASETQTTNNRGGYLTGLNNYMIDGESYRIEFKAKSSRERTLTARFEAASATSTTSTSMDLATTYKTFHLDIIYNENAAHKSLVFYNTNWDSKETLSIKEVKLSELETVRDNELLRRVMVTNNGNEIRKIRHITKH